MLDEQRRTIIAEYCEKVSHHELFAAQAEQNRRILQEELLRQQQDFREVHQQDLMKVKELQKFQNSTFDEFAQKKFIEDQKIIMELSATSTLLSWVRPFHDMEPTPGAVIGIMWAYCLVLFIIQNVVKVLAYAAVNHTKFSLGGESSGNEGLGATRQVSSQR